MVHPEAEMHTPYGATESLPVATIEAREVLGETAAKTAQGAGVCVGRKFDTIDWRVIRISDEPIASIDDAEELPRRRDRRTDRPRAAGLADVCGLPAAWLRQGVAAVTTQPAAMASSRPGRSPGLQSTTLLRKSATATLSGIASATSVISMTQGRFWYCGRKSQRVETSEWPALTRECCEAVFNALPGVRRTALVGVGPRGNQTPGRHCRTDATSACRCDDESGYSPTVDASRRMV